MVWKGSKNVKGPLAYEHRLGFAGRPSSYETDSAIGAVDGSGRRGGGGLFLNGDLKKSASSSRECRKVLSGTICDQDLASTITVLSGRHRIELQKEGIVPSWVEREPSHTSRKKTRPVSGRWGVWYRTSNGGGGHAKALGLHSEKGKKDWGSDGQYDRKSDPEPSSYKIRLLGQGLDSRKHMETGADFFIFNGLGGAKAEGSY